VSENITVAKLEQGQFAVVAMGAEVLITIVRIRGPDSSSRGFPVAYLHSV